MAQVKWQKRAENELYRYLVKGVIEFGETTANNFAAKVSSLNKDLEKFPGNRISRTVIKRQKETLQSPSYYWPFQINLLLLRKNRYSTYSRHLGYEARTYEVGE